MFSVLYRKWNWSTSSKEKREVPVSENGKITITKNIKATLLKICRVITVNMELF